MRNSPIFQYTCHVSSKAHICCHQPEDQGSVSIMLLTYHMPLCWASDHFNTFLSHFDLLRKGKLSISSFFNVESLGLILRRVNLSSAHLFALKNHYRLSWRAVLILRVRACLSHTASIHSPRKGVIGACTHTLDGVSKLKIIFASKRYF